VPPADDFHGLFQRVLAASDGGDGSPFRRERERDCLAESAARAGDEGDFVGEEFHI